MPLDPDSDPRTQMNADPSGSTSPAMSFRILVHFCNQITILCLFEPLRYLMPEKNPDRGGIFRGFFLSVNPL